MDGKIEGVRFLLHLLYEYGFWDHPNRIQQESDVTVGWLILGCYNF